MNKLTTGTLSVLLLTAAGCGGGSGQNSDAGSSDWLPLKVGNRWTYQITDVDDTVSVKVQGVTAQQLVGGDGDSKATMAFKLVTGNRYNDAEGDVSYQGLVESRVVRFRELSIEGMTGATKKEEYFSTPWKLRVDVSAEHTTAGASWPESYTEFVVDTPKLPTSDAAVVTADAGGGAVADAGVDDAGVADAGRDAGLITTMTQVTDLWSVVAVDQSVTVPAGTFKALVVRRRANAGTGSDKTFWFVRGIGKVKETGVGEQTEELTSYTFP